uniref:Niemann-Pick C1 protein n=1 Tax=Caligus rogercresseyi TaxID=217165 RepID=C1BMW9_CALRO|nr:Niemann-Pick C1 protein precursor [Caligus rogercresseyi]
MLLNPVLFLSILAYLVDFTSGEGHCVLRDVCGRDPTLPAGTNINLLCTDSGPPNEMKEKLKKLMAKVCPHFEPEISSKICCTRRQIKDLQMNMLTLRAVVGHCPSCFYDIRRLFCDLTCHPEQSNFLHAAVKVWGENPKGEEVEMVKELNYYLSPTFFNVIYEACKNVLFPSQSMSVLPFLCGTALCSPEKLLKYMGTQSRVTSPFQINFIPSKDPIVEENNLQLYDPPTFPCNAAPSTDTDVCSSANCELSCPTLDFSVYKGPSTNFLFTIGGTDGLVIVMASIFVLFSIGFIGTLIYGKIYRRT